MLHQCKTLFLSAAILHLLAAPLSAAVGYVTDSFEITMRSGPSNQNKILSMLKSGTRMQVLQDQGDWVRVSARGKEGWVLKRYVTASVPKGQVIKRLQSENERLARNAEQATGKSSSLAEQNTSLSGSLQTTTQELARVKRELAELQTDASQVLELKENYRQATDRLTQLTTEAERLENLNKQLRKDSSLRWMLSGAGIVFFSWVVGFGFGRSGRKRKSSLMYS